MSDTKPTRKNEMLPVTFVGSLYKAHAVLRSKIADVHGKEVHDVWTWKFVWFRKNFLFLLHITIVYAKRRNLFTKIPANQWHLFKATAVVIKPFDHRK